MKNILISGGAGYIGSHVSKLLLDKDYNVIIIDNLVKGYEKLIDKRAKFYKGDISDKKILEKIFNENKIDAVLHFAAFIEAGESMKEPAKYFKNNVSKSISFLNFLIKKGVNKIIFSSSAAVYGAPEYTPIDEEHTKKPINNYGLTKLIIEKILDSYAKAYNLRYISLRYFNAAGAEEDASLGEMHEPETHLIPNILKTVKGEKEKIFVFGEDYDTKDGTCIRDFIHVKDLAKAHLNALEKIDEIKKDVFNLGGGKGVSVKEVIDLCEKITGKKINKEFKEKREGDPPVLIASSEKANKLLDWKAEKTIQDIIKDAWNWEKLN